MPYLYTAELQQRTRQEHECQLEVGTHPKHYWNSFTDLYGPGTSTKLPSVHCLKQPRLQKSLDDVSHHLLGKIRSSVPDLGRYLSYYRREDSIYRRKEENKK